MCDNFGFTQLYGKVCVNPIPENVKQLIRENREVLGEIKALSDPAKGTARFWAYPPYTPSGSENSDAFDFPDPMEHLVGFFSVCRTGEKPSPAAAPAKRPRPKAVSQQKPSVTPRAANTRANPKRHVTPSVSPPAEPDRLLSHVRENKKQPQGMNDRQDWSQSVQVPEVVLEEEEGKTESPQKKGYMGADAYTELVVEEEPPGMMPASSGSESAAKLRATVALPVVREEQPDSPATAEESKQRKGSMHVDSKQKRPARGAVTARPGPRSILAPKKVAVKKYVASLTTTAE